LKLLAFWTSFALFKNQVPVFSFSVNHSAVQDNEPTKTFFDHKMPINGVDLKDLMHTRTFISVLLSKIRAF
jgi:hypothetical protein